MTDDVSGEKGTLARIVSVEARASRLLRSAEEGGSREHCIVANAQQLAIVTVLADPPPETGMIDRCLVAAYDTGVEPLLVLTKANLASPDRPLDSCGALGLRVTVVDLGSHRGLKARRLEEGDAEASGLKALRKALAGVETVLVGYSGVRKSTLISALVPDVDRATGEVNTVTGKERHTSTSVVSLALSGGRRVVDTPGVHGFDLTRVSPQDVLREFTDLTAITKDCPRGHERGRGPPECALSERANLRLIARTASFRRLLATCTEDWSRECPSPASAITSPSRARSSTASTL